MSLIESIDFESNSVPLNQHSTSSKAYILHLTSLQDTYAASTSTPSNAIHIVDKHTLQQRATFLAHAESITSLKAVDSLAGSNRPSLVSSSMDGSVKSWDARTSREALTLKSAGRPLLCCDLSPNGLTVAAGTELKDQDAHILYWDPRKPAAPMYTHTSTHSDDITVVRFGLASAPHLTLLSASSDGLLTVSNAEEADEDEAALCVGNWGCSVAQAGWIFGAARPAVWASSDMETLSTWSDELGLMHSFDIRGPSVHTQHTTWVTDYVIGTHSTPLALGLKVFVGSNEGDFALISSEDLSDSAAHWSLHRVWAKGHVGIVRSILWDYENDILVSGGEDARINVWSGLGVSPSSFSESAGDQMDIDED